MLRLEAAQLRPKKGKVDENLARVREWIRGVSGEVDLIVFPECALSGYFVEGGQVRSAVRSRRLQLASVLLKRARQTL